MGDYFIEDRQANYLVYMQNIASNKEADNDIRFEETFKF